MAPRTTAYPADLPSLPSVFRLTTMHSAAMSPQGFEHTAHLYHFPAAIKVQWRSARPDPALAVGSIVSPRWCGRGRSEGGCLQIARLVVLQRPVADMALFATVPPGWVSDRALLARAQALVDLLPSAHRLLFHAIFWDGGRMRRFCTGPSSIEGHHNSLCGNLRHTVEVAEQVLALARTRAHVDQAVAVLSALLHDAGKADEYCLRPDQSWALSDRGRLLGHRTTVIEWIAAAIGRWTLRLPAGHETALLHNLSAVPHAPAWMGLREPQTPESDLLSIADKLSGSDDLMQRLLTPQPGWGAYHKHLGRRPYRVASSPPA